MENNEVPQECEIITNPMDLFIADLDVNLGADIRINSIKKLTTVALALGVEKTQTELISYLNNLTDGNYNDDEILMNLAEQLRNFLPFIGGPENVSLLLTILEKLCAVDEFVVRNKAIETLKDICKELDDGIVESEFVHLVFRLIESDWFTSKCSAAALVSVCYPRSNDNTKTQLRNLYKVLCQNDAPLVRRAAAANLSSFIEILETEFVKEFIPVYEIFGKDDQDSVRLLSIDIGIGICFRLTTKDIEELMISSLTEICGDSSWRVRYQAANQISSIQRAIGQELTQKYLITIYQNLVHDIEPQVREASATSLARFCEHLQQNYYSTHNNENTISPVMINQIFPLIKILDQDCNSDVKEALSSIITSLSPLFGQENTKLLLLPLITSSLLHDSSKIKENIISNLNNIISVIGMDDIADTVLQIVTDLVNSSASIWRTRRNLIVTINYIAKHSGKEYFDQHLKPLYYKLLSDGVYAVRKTAPLILPILIKQFGFKWAKNSILNDILLYADHSHYLYRYVCLFCIDQLVSPNLELDLRNATTEINQYRYLFHICDVETKNDQVTSFLARITKLNKDLQAKLKEDWICDTLTHLRDNDIPNDNMKLYIEETIGMFTKNNNLDITCVILEEIIKDDVYLEGLLNFILNTCMDVLCHLSSDLVDNVHSLVGKTLVKIENLSNVLQIELKSLALECNNENSFIKVEESVEGRMEEKTEQVTSENKSMETKLM